MTLGERDSIALLDVLRPPKHYRTEVALLGTYSADLVAVVACLLALAGEGDDDRKMPPTAVATALTRMSGRVRVVAQAGRVQVPHKGRRTMVLADRWIREVHVDGNARSWHPKVALVCQQADGLPARWVLWVGSRNLTRDVSWDLGLAIVGTEDGAASASLPGLPSVAAALAGHAELEGWPEEVLLERLSGVSWDLGAQDVRLRQVVLHGEDGPRTLPATTRGATHLLAVSPFVKTTGLRLFQRWGAEGATRRLATTPGALVGLGSKARSLTNGWQLRTMEVGAEALGTSDTDPTGDEQYEEVHRGLHAKALLAWSPSRERAALWLGSANLTARAWTGNSTEIMVELDVARAVAQELWEFTDSGHFRSEHPELEGLEDPDEDGGVPAVLDALRNTIGGWDAPEIVDDGETLTLRFAHPRPVDPPCSAQVGLLGQPTDEWPIGAAVVRLKRPPEACWTELLVVRLEVAGDEAHEVEFLLRGHWRGGIGANRDRRVLSRLLGARAFLRWIVALLGDAAMPDDWNWPDDEDRTRTKRSQRGGGGGTEGPKGIHLPTVEAVLRAWMRDPRRVSEVDSRIRELMETVEVEERAMEEPDEEALDALEELKHHWAVLHLGLAEDDA